MTSINEWNHVGTKENPADLLSRGVTPNDLKGSELWWNGPRWLQDDDKTQSEIQKVDENEIYEVIKPVLIAMPIQNGIDPFAKFSMFNKLVRVVARCIRFARACKQESEQKLSGPLSSEELEHARKCIIKKEQRSAFFKELGALREGGEISKKSRLKSINPFISDDGLLRVGGRLQNSHLQHDAKHLIVLPHRSRFTDLIIEHEHRRILHAGVGATLAAVRQSYWPPRARSTIKRIIHKCVICFKSRPRISEQIMGNLPIHRVIPSKPFSSTGVDFCGPLYVRDGKRRNSKRIKVYVAVFVCMATKAVHLEVVSDMTTETFLNAFKCFIGRQGKPADVFSDNGTNFVGANRELEELRVLFAQEEHRSKIIDNNAMDRIRWHFIPSRAPHFGGLWKAAVKSFKTQFYKVASDASLTFEEASTLAIQIEAILNSRPMTAMSSNPNDMSYLTAGHFLIGSAITSYPEPGLAHLKINQLSRWQHVEEIRQHF
ncbi:uncharacterized protein LOC107272139 [Cephus cinctus]|uniref:Uncharacterized protein LOC107272139 n=1 Tax=Cephus cinctus TaxID=211228 RepID=A0AAJ7C8J0_CEPCN|nr:uncharacterized protein LOC107272139 [Cephus cinctus]